MQKEKTPYQKSIRYLYSLQKYGIKFGLSKTSNLLKALGNPHKGQKYIHIAGTNGKGSVAAFLASILKRAGLNVGLYSSPHLVRFTERFRINDTEITQEKATALINELRDIFVPAEPPTFFEATTALALAYFARENTDVAIMEVGMGGRLDATNVITPMVSIITNIAMEHQFFLGSRLIDIAGEKAGIIKKGIDVITGVSQKGVISLLEDIAIDKKAPLWRVGKDIRYRQTGSGLHYYGIKLHYKRLHLGLKGKFQNRNAAIALAVIERLEEKGLKVSSRDICQGLAGTLWPGRMQVVAKDPTVMLDGAHNPSAIKALAESINTGFNYRHLILVIGVMKDKEIGRMLSTIVPLSDYVIYTRPVYHRAANPKALMEKAENLGKPGEVISLLADALDRAREMASPLDLILICGSLFTVGEAMTYFDPEGCMPKSL